MNNPSIESHFAIQFFFTDFNYNEEKQVFKEEKFKVQIDINYNEENKLFKVQKRCVFLI